MLNLQVISPHDRGPWAPPGASTLPPPAAVLGQGAAGFHHPGSLMPPSNHLPWLWRAPSSWRDSFSGPGCSSQHARPESCHAGHLAAQDQVEKATLEDGTRRGDFQDLVEGGLGVMFNGQLSLCRRSAAELNLPSLLSSVVRVLASTFSPHAPQVTVTASPSTEFIFAAGPL